MTHSATEQRKSTPKSPRPGGRGRGLGRRQSRWHPGPSLLTTELWLLSSLVAKTNNISNSHYKILHLCMVYYVSPTAVSQSLTESPQLSEINQAGIRASFTMPAPLKAWSLAHLPLSTGKTALPGILSPWAQVHNFPHSTIPPPILSLS